MHASKNTEEHIAGFPSPIRERLEKIRATIQKAAPKAEETISYGIPTYKQNGNLVHFAGYKNHIGFYPGSGAVEAFKKEFTGYKTSKGALLILHDQPLPLKLISQIVKFRVLQNTEKEASKNAIKPVARKPAAKQTKSKPTDEEQVNTWIAKRSPAAKKEIETVRTIIRSVGAKLGERIKWNAPSYYHRSSGTDMLTFGPHRDAKILLVFHHPVIVNIKSSLLEGDYKDRRLAYFKNSAEASKNKKELVRIIKEMIRLIEK